MIDLSSYSAIQSNLFVRIDVEYYKADAGSSATSTVLRFSDLNRNYTISGETYNGLGRLMGVTSSASELRVSEYEISVTLSGIPNSSIYEIVNSKIKGCPIKIYRVLFDTSTHQALAITGNPMVRFQGIINNYSLNEEFDSNDRSGTNTLVLSCTSEVSILTNKIAGLRTNPESLKVFNSSDLSFDRVPNLKNTTFNFGA